MDETSGIRAARRHRRRSAVVALWLLAALLPGAAAAASGTKHEEPKAAPAPPPEPPKPPPKKVLEPLVRLEAPPRVPRMPADGLTGLAIGGFDTVAYMVDGSAREGRPDYETEWRGAVWRFVNEGNLAAFKDHPEVYAPRFVGYCAFQMGRGFAAESRPSEFVVYKRRLYLFASSAHRIAFMADPDQAVELAEKNWEAVSRELP